MQPNYYAFKEFRDHKAIPLTRDVLRNSCLTGGANGVISLLGLHREEAYKRKITSPEEPVIFKFGSLLLK